jgi:hypothetical protein
MRIQIAARLLIYGLCDLTYGKSEGLIVFIGRSLTIRLRPVCTAFRDLNFTVMMSV